MRPDVDGPLLQDRTLRGDDLAARSCTKQQQGAAERCCCWGRCNDDRTKTALCARAYSAAGRHLLCTVWTLPRHLAVCCCRHRRPASRVQLDTFLLIFVLVVVILDILPRGGPPHTVFQPQGAQKPGARRLLQSHEPKAARLLQPRALLVADDLVSLPPALSAAWLALAAEWGTDASAAAGSRRWRAAAAAAATGGSSRSIRMLELAARDTEADRPAQQSGQAA